MSLSAMNGVRRVGQISDSRRRRSDGVEQCSPSAAADSPQAAQRNLRGTRSAERSAARQPHCESATGGSNAVQPSAGHAASPSGGDYGFERRPREGVIRERATNSTEMESVAGPSADVPPPAPRRSAGDSGSVWNVPPVHAASIGEVLSAEKLRAQLGKAHEQLSQLAARHTGLSTRSSAAEAERDRLRAQLDAAGRREAELERLISLRDSHIAAAAERERGLRLELEQLRRAHDCTPSQPCLPAMRQMSSNAKLDDMERTAAAMARTALVEGDEEGQRALDDGEAYEVTVPPAERGWMGAADVGAAVPEAARREAAAAPSRAAAAAPIAAAAERGSEQRDITASAEQQRAAGDARARADQPAAHEPALPARFVSPVSAPVSGRAAGGAAGEAAGAAHSAQTRRAEARAVAAARTVAEERAAAAAAAAERAARAAAEEEEAAAAAAAAASAERAARAAAEEEAAVAAVAAAAAETAAAHPNGAARAERVATFHAAHSGASGRAAAAEASAAAAASAAGAVLVGRVSPGWKQKNAHIMVCLGCKGKVKNDEFLLAQHRCP